MDDLPDAIIANPLGAASKEKDHALAKSGDLQAADKLAKKLVTQELIDTLRGTSLPSNSIVVAVNSIEATGKNALPIAAALLIADALGFEIDTQIIQTNRPKRTALNGLDRLFNPPTFEGMVEKERNYILVDDTITQGRTFAALRKHIHGYGGVVSTIIALTGKQYSSKLNLDKETLKQLDVLYGDIAHAFKQATGHSFSELTASEARYLSTFREPDKVRDRILAQAHARTSSHFTEDARTETRQSTVDDDSTAKSAHFQAQTAAKEQHALLDAASVEQAWDVSLKQYAQAKHAQVERLEGRLQNLVADQQNRLQQTQNQRPGMLSLPSRKKAWQKTLQSQQQTLGQLQKRLSSISTLRRETEMGSPKIEELATGKLRLKQPELASSWDAMREQERQRRLQALQARQEQERKQAQERERQQQKQRQEQAQSIQPEPPTQTQGRGRSLGRKIGHQGK